MGIVDLFIILIFVLFIIYGYQRGFIKTISDFISIVFTSIISGVLSDILFNIIYRFLPFLNFFGKAKGLKSLNIISWKLTFYIIIYILMIKVIDVIYKKFKLDKKIMDSMIEVKFIGKVLGAIVSILLSYVAIFNVILILLNPVFNNKYLASSKVSNYIMNNTFILSGMNKSLYNNEIYSIKRINKSDNNYKKYSKVNNDIIINMLKTNFISDKIISNLSDKNKLLGTRKKIKKEESDSDINTTKNINETITTPNENKVEDETTKNSWNKNNNSTKEENKENVTINPSDYDSSDDEPDDDSDDYCNLFPDECRWKEKYKWKIKKDLR